VRLGLPLLGALLQERGFPPRSEACWDWLLKDRGPNSSGSRLAFLPG
jgi:hypothetical protein